MVLQGERSTVAEVKWEMSVKIATPVMTLALVSVCAASTPGEPVLLTADLGFAADLRKFGISNDGECVYFCAEDDSRPGNPIHLFDVPIVGGQITQHTAEVSDIQVDVREWNFCPTGDFLIYMRGNHPNHADLYRLSLDTGHTAQLTFIDEVQDLLYPQRGFLITPDGASVIYSASFSLMLNELYSVRIDGTSPPVRINGPMVGSSSNALKVSITPDSQRVLYVADQEVDRRQDLYVGSPDGGATVRLNGTTGLAGKELDYLLSQDGSRVIYNVYVTGQGERLFSRPVEGGSEVALTPGLPGGREVKEQWLSPDGQWVFYSADARTDGRYELYSVPLSGGTSVRVSGETLAEGDSYVTNLAFSPDSSQVAFAIQGPESSSVWLASCADGEAVLVHEWAGDGARLSFTPDGERMLIRSGWSYHDMRLFSCPTDGGPGLYLGPHTHGGYTFRLLPDGEHIVYTSGIGDSRDDLYCGRVDGASEPVLLSTDAYSGIDEIGGVQVSPDGLTVVYSRLDAWDEHLYSVRIPVDSWLADVNGDGGVDLRDYDIIARNWAATGEGVEGDISGPNGIPDGIVDSHDFKAFLEDLEASQPLESR